MLVEAETRTNILASPSFPLQFPPVPPIDQIGRLSSGQSPCVQSSQSKKKAGVKKFSRFGSDPLSLNINWLPEMHLGLPLMYMLGAGVIAHQ